MEAMKSRLYKQDVRWILFFNNTLKCRALDRSLPIVTYLGGAVATISLCLLLIGFGGGTIHKIGLEALISLAVSHLLVQIVKRSVCRKRPKDVLEEINTFRVPLDVYSFPSGHTTAVFSLITTLFFYDSALALALLPIGVVISISRIYIGVHYPSDVIVGLLIGVVSSVAVHGVLQ